MWAASVRRVSRRPIGLVQEGALEGPSVEVPPSQRVSARHRGGLRAEFDEDLADAARVPSQGP
eukprot:CAMPEP_0181271864 /NCGR_PEP_ID=MMETSP1097-20121128/7654_1 /TAXON_ID=35684 /ORGANISM="Pseudopedinella elastica, Strain CCMP716" /LENGTH=62 /DNA_ID=CAMNT_0023372373 /DNA_START=140 /DNA_END=326 /DNA_ORIENTATION=-